jgi:hypothetical protein
MGLIKDLRDKFLTNECDIVLLPTTDIMDLSTRTNKLNTFLQNNLGENECGKNCMKIREREQQRGEILTYINFFSSKIMG